MGGCGQIRTGRLEKHAYNRELVEDGLHILRDYLVAFNIETGIIFSIFFIE